MKKIIIIALMAMFAMPTMAQIRISTQKTELEVVTKFSGGMRKLYYTADTGYCLSLTTSNQFDDPFLIYIGETKQEAIESLDSFSYLIDNLKKGDNTSFTDLSGREISVSFDLFMGGKLLWFSADGYAGQSSIIPKEITKIKEAIEKHGK